MVFKIYRNYFICGKIQLQKIVHIEKKTLKKLFIFDHIYTL